MNSTKPIIIAVILLNFSGCSQEAPSISTTTKADASHKKENKLPAAIYFYESTNPETIGNEIFSASPGMICNTNAQPIEVSVRWDISKKEASNAFIYVASRNGEKKLWVSGGTQGEEITGKWIFPGTRLTLSKEIDGAPVSELIIESINCKQVNL